MFTLPVKVSACFRSSSSQKNTIMSMKPRLPPNRFAMRQVFRLGRRRRRSELELQDGRIVKKGGAQEIQHPIFLSGHGKVASGVRYGEVHVVIRVRHDGTDVSLNNLIKQPAPVDNGETRLPDQWGVAIQGSSRRDASRNGRSASRWNI